jgi:hypothetical protein
MTNENPIRLEDYDEFVSYNIPRKYLDKKLYLTTFTTVKDQLWKMDIQHIVSLNGDPFDFDADPDINSQEIGICKDLQNKEFCLETYVGRINNGSLSGPPPVTYQLLFQADEANIDDEKIMVESDSRNPVTFYTRIIFKIV